VRPVECWFGLRLAITGSDAGALGQAGHLVHFLAATASASWLRMSWWGIRVVAFAWAAALARGRRLAAVGLAHAHAPPTRLLPAHTPHNHHNSLMKNKTILKKIYF
jgi:hypothetical protein